MSCLAKQKNRGEGRVSLCRAVGGALALFVGMSGNGWAGTASFRVTFESSWSAATHPQDYPSNAHYSPLVGGTHNANASFWRPGGMATEGIRRMAELGSTPVLLSEVDAAIAAGNARGRLLGPALGTTPASVAMNLELDDQFPLVTLVTMIAPSPDWFVGVHDLPLYANGSWVGKQVVDLLPYDTGTDNGVSFRSPDSATSPREPIHVLSDTFPFQGTGPLGKFTFLRLLDGDLNETGDLDVGDLDELSVAIRTGRSESRWDLNRDQQVNSADRVYWIEQLSASTFGDANLDGRFNSDDLLAVFQAGQYQDGIVANSGWMQGDWDGSGDFDSTDLLLAFQRGGYGDGSAVRLSAVPEPSATMLLSLALPLWWAKARRRAWGSTIR